MRARVDGPFRVTGDDGSDLTPKGMKERALLALLLLSPGQRRTRAWLQSKLWSDRSPEQASGSCRQALANLRKALGPARDRLCSDRTTVWLSPPVPVIDEGEGELLDDLDVRDPEFADLLRDHRQARETTTPIPLVPLLRGHAPGRPIVAIFRYPRAGGERAAFLLRALGQRIAGDLALQAIDAVAAEGDGHDDTFGADTAAVIELESYLDRDTAHVLVQVLSSPARRLTWSGRMSLEGPVGDIWDSEAANRAVNRAVQAVIDITSAIASLRPLSALNRAVQRIYDFDRTRLARADELLREGTTGELQGLALAWRGFVRLTWALEFRDQSGAEEANALADEALRLMHDHPVVLSLVSQIRLKLTGDTEAAHWLALRAAEIGDQNPYALDALSQSLIMHGDYRQADLLAARARRAAQGLPHSFSWDMQACLSALSVGRYEAAMEAAAECHRKMPFYRPALRYLVALSLILDRRAEAQTWTERLRRLEPDFTPGALGAPDYPVDTLRALGLVDVIRPRLTGGG